MWLDVSGLTAVVTGGTSGIGLATARILLGAGANLAVCGRNPDRLSGAADTLAETAQERLLARTCDVLDSAQVARFAGEVEDRFGGTDILVCNAGQGRMSTFAETTDEDWREELELKFFSVIHTVRAFHPALARSDNAAIVCVNSLLAKQPEPHMVATSAARAGLLNLVRSLATELAPDGIRVNSILLGLIDTGQWRRRYEVQAGEDESYADWTAALAKDRNIPLGRLGRPNEPANAIAFLASPLSSYTTGAALDISGGLARHV